MAMRAVTKMVVRLAMAASIEATRPTARMRRKRAADGRILKSG
jgi:hypothetical protein